MLRPITLTLMATMFFTTAELARHTTNADVIITINMLDDFSQPLPPAVVTGANFTAEILLSVTPDISPLFDLRGITFDFSSTSETIDILTFTWFIEPAFGSSQYLIFTSLPMPGAAYVGFSSIEGFILHLTTQPMLIAKVTGQINDSGTFNVGVGEEFTDGGGATFSAGFNPVFSFDTASENIVGGSSTVTVNTGNPPDNSNNNTPPANDNHSANHNVNDNHHGNHNENSGQNTNDNRDNDNLSGNVNQNDNDNTNVNQNENENSNDNQNVNNNTNVNVNANNNTSNENQNVNANDNTNPPVNENTSNNTNDNVDDNANDNSAGNDNQPANSNQPGNSNQPANSNQPGGTPNNPSTGICGLGMMGYLLAMSAGVMMWRTRRWLSS